MPLTMSIYNSEGIFNMIYRGIILMSLETWINEFYPQDAVEFRVDSSLNDMDAIEHSIKKWEGLLQENLEKHCVVYRRNQNIVTDMESSGAHIFISSGSCALCVVHYSKCSACPLGISYGKPCDCGRNSPYRHFRATKDPEPMINELKKALKYLKEDK